MHDFNSVLSDANQLPVTDCIQLIEALWTTVPEDAEWPLSPEWQNEIARRSAEYDAGLVQTIPWEQIRAAALRRAGLTVPESPR
jgi:putative addiction module component (TIGR02574 family)